MVTPGIFSLSIIHYFLNGNIFWLLSLLWTNYGICLWLSRSMWSLITIVIIFSGPIKQWDWRMQSSLKQLILRSKCPKEKKNRISRKIGTPIHQKMALKSLVWHNSKGAGFVSPQEFGIRKSSPRVWGSPLSSPRLK